MSYSCSSTNSELKSGFNKESEEGVICQKSARARDSEIYEMSEIMISQLVFVISQLPEQLELKVKTISNSPVHADYDNVLCFFHMSK